jgi:hypothetical protein
MVIHKSGHTHMHTQTEGHTHTHTHTERETERERERERERKKERDKEREREEERERAAGKKGKTGTKQTRYPGSSAVQVNTVCAQWTRRCNSGAAGAHLRQNSQ